MSLFFQLEKVVQITFLLILVFPSFIRNMKYKYYHPLIQKYCLLLHLYFSCVYLHPSVPLHLLFSLFFSHRNCANVHTLSDISVFLPPQPSLTDIREESSELNCDQLNQSIVTAKTEILQLPC